MESALKSSSDPISIRTQECLTELETRFKETKLPADTILIVGRTGAGKSSLLEDLTGLSGYSQESVNSVTQNVEIGKAVIEKKDYFIMDTPGFDPGNEERVFSEIIRGIQSVRTVARITGLLYLTCINQSRFDEFDRKLIQFIYALCGDNYIPRVTFVTTFWTISGKAQGERYNDHLKSLQSKWKQEVHAQNLKTYQHGQGYYAGGLETGWVIDWFENRDQIAQHAREMITHNYSDPTVLQDHANVPVIVRELNANIPIHLTDAGRLLGLRSNDPASNESPREESERLYSGASDGSNPQPGRERQSNTAPEAPQSSSWIQTGLDIIYWVIQNVEFNGSGGGPGQGGPNMNRGYRGPIDLLSSVDVMKSFGMDSSKEGRFRYATNHGIGGEPFSAEWGNAIRNHVLRNRR